MDLEFVEKRRGRADRSSWTPFEPSKSFNSDWWNDPLQYSWDDAWFVQVLRDGDEVGRVRLEKPLSLAHYGVDPNLVAAPCSCSGDRTDRHLGPTPRLAVTCPTLGLTTAILNL